VKELRNLIRPCVRAVPAYRLVEEKAEVKLSQNESPFDVPVELKEKVFERLRKRAWNRYAQEVPNRVQALLAERNKWPFVGVVLGAGSNLLLQLIAYCSVEPKGIILAPTPCFALYALIAGLVDGLLKEVPFPERFVYEERIWIEAIEKHNPSLVFLCTPNNPTGSFMSKRSVEAVVKVSKGLVVVDEAYREFAGEDCRDLLPKYKNLILIRTFSKAFSAAGIRLGYLLAHPEIAEQIGKAVPPFNVNVLTATAAEVFLENPQVVQQRVNFILKERERIIQEIGKLPGVKVFPTRANFFLLETKLQSEDLAERFARLGIAVRVLKGPGLEKCIRVNVGTEEENDRFLDGLKEILKESIK